MRGLGFGLDVAVVEDPTIAGLHLSERYFWLDGIATRQVWASPHEQRVLFMYIPNPPIQTEIEAAVASGS